jgi:hypothetical protein
LHSFWRGSKSSRRKNDSASPKRNLRIHFFIDPPRAANVLMIAGALAIVPLLSSIQAAWHLSLLVGGGLGVVLVLRGFGGA